MNALTEIGKHSAAGQYLGYALQPVRLCFHLLNAPDGASVSLEYLDDVAVHLADGSLILEQNKSAQKQNPISDWAVDLWKTLANWLGFIAAGEIDPTITTFRMYITPMKSGAFATALNDAKSDEDVKNFVENLHKRLDQLKTPPACISNVQAFLGASPDHRAMLVKRLTVVSVDSDPVDPIRALFKLNVSPSIIELVCERAIGAAKEAADRLIRANKPAVLNADAFRAEQRAFVQQNNLPGFLSSFTDSPPSEVIQQAMADRPAFVRQLELIDAGEDACVRAVGDYLRTIADISIWGESGLIFEKNLKDWNSDLIGRHQHIAAEIQDLYSDKELTARGRIVYRRCAQLQAPLDGRVVPGHFVHGSYNSLAHELRLGWHPDYKKLLEPGS